MGSVGSRYVFTFRLFHDVRPSDNLSQRYTCTLRQTIHLQRLHEIEHIRIVARVTHSGITISSFVSNAKVIAMARSMISSPLTLWLSSFKNPPFSYIVYDYLCISPVFCLLFHGCPPSFPA